MTFTREFDIDFENPCGQASKVFIVGPDSLAEENYFIGSPSKPLTQHGEFSVQTSPNTHSLCGGVTVVALYDNAPVDGDPVTYESANRRFVAYSNDQNLIIVGEGEMRLVATLTEYPAGPQNPNAS